MDALELSLQRIAAHLELEVRNLESLPKSNLIATASGIYRDALSQINNFNKILQSCQKN